MAFQLLFADDSATMHRVVQITLAREDAQVWGVSSGRDAVLRARERRPDIAVLDVNMPDMDGYAACQALKDDPSTSHIPVLLLASSQEPLDAQRAQDCGADGHLLKPFDTQGFIDKVKQTLSQAGGRAAAPAPQAQAPQPQAQAPMHAPAAAPAHAPWAPQTSPGFAIDQHAAPHVQPQMQAHPQAGASFPAAQPGGVRPHPAQAPAQTQARPAASSAPFAGTTTPGAAPSRQPQPSTLPHAHVPQAQPHAATGHQSAVTQVPRATSQATAAPASSVNAWKVPAGAASMATPAPRPGQSPTARTPLPPSAQAQGHVAPAAQVPRTQTVQAPLGGAAGMTGMAQRMASAVAPAAVSAMQRAQPSTGGLDTTELMAAAKEILERVAWEVVPPMAESMIKEHIERLARR